MSVADQMVPASLSSKFHAKPGKSRGTTRSEMLFKQPEKVHKAILWCEKWEEKILVLTGGRKERRREVFQDWNYTLQKCNFATIDVSYLKQSLSS